MWLPTSTFYLLLIKFGEMYSYSLPQTGHALSRGIQKDLMLWQK